MTVVVAVQDLEAKHAQQVTVLKDGWAKELKRQREVLPHLFLAHVTNCTAYAH